MFAVQWKETAISYFALIILVNHIRTNIYIANIFELSKTQCFPVLLSLQSDSLLLSVGSTLLLESLLGAGI
jgi:hypothetical protein